MVKKWPKVFIDMIYFIIYFSPIDVAMWSLNQNHTTVDVMVRKHEVDKVKQYLDKKNVPYNILIEDLQRAIDTENPPKDHIEALQNRKGMSIISLVTIFLNNNNKYNNKKCKICIALRIANDTNLNFWSYIYVQHNGLKLYLYSIRITY